MPYLEGEGKMKIIRWTLLFLMLVVSSSSFATQIIIGKGSRSYPITSLTFGITSPSGISPGTSPCIVGNAQVTNCDFVNESGTTWENLLIKFDPFQPGNNLFCSGEPWYKNCQFSFAPNGQATGVFFFNIPSTAHCDAAQSEFCGIPSGLAGDFIFDVQGFTAPTDFDGQANVPEPRTATLLLGGLIALGIWRFRRLRVAG
jgi:hypothetical protein